MGPTATRRGRPAAPAVLIAAGALLWAVTGAGDPSAPTGAERRGPSPPPEAAGGLQPLSSLDASGTPPPLAASSDLKALSRETRGLTGSGTLSTVAGSSERHGDGPVRRFAVDVEDGLPVDREEIAAEVERTLFDERGWTSGGRLALRRVDSGPVSFRVTVASPETTDRLCAPLVTRGRLSCFQGERAVLNAWRWLEGASSYSRDLAGYRRYLVNHEVGHALGHAEHVPCPRPGAPAPVMMQQTLGVDACEPSPWPTAAERASVAQATATP